MIRGSKRVVSNQPPAASFGIHNRFDIEVIDSATGRLKQEAKAYNVICNQLWTMLFARTYKYFSYIHYGSGDGTPAASDTSLFNYVGSEVASGETASIDYKKGVFSLRKQIQLAAATAAGVTITEVGIAYGTGASCLCTHAMLEDMNGNRVSIAKTDTDVVNIYATVYVHFNPNGYDGGHIRPVTCVTTRGLFAFLCGHNNTEFPDMMYLTKFDTLSIIPGSAGSRPSSDDTYDEGSGRYVAVTVAFDETNKTITFTPARLEASKYNLGGFRYLNLWRYSYSSAAANLYEPWCILRPGGTWFPGTRVTSEAVGTGDGSTVDYSLEFPFASDMRVYVDGVETTDFTYEYAPNTTGDLWRYMKVIHPDSTVDNHIDMIFSYYDTPYPRGQVLYNPASELGVGSVTCYACVEIYASNDLLEWDLVIPRTTTDTSNGSKRTLTIPTEYANSRYWKVISYTSVTGLDYSWPLFKAPSTFTGKTLHFNTPPAAGAVITVDYTTDTVAKNANHVFDLSVTIQLGEYSGE